MTKNKHDWNTWLQSRVLRENTGDVLYHITDKKHVPKIRREGLVPMQTSNWVMGDDSRYGRGEIYAFESRKDAIKWGFKMEWEFYQELGGGNIYLISLLEKGEWEVDESDPISQAGAEGKWLKKMEHVLPSDIIDFQPITKELMGVLKENTRDWHLPTPGSPVEQFMRQYNNIASPFIGMGIDDTYMWQDEDGKDTAVTVIFPRDDQEVHFDFIEVMKNVRGKGQASRVFRKVTNLADEYGVTITLKATADPIGAQNAKGWVNPNRPVVDQVPGLSTDDLVKWYTRHGFKGNPNRMVRTPTLKTA